ncbi:MAG: FHA domain-containing protein [Prevotella sp.]
MKRVRCPKCDNYITFDETRYEDGQSLVFVCPECNKQFGIRIGVSRLRNRQKEEDTDSTPEDSECGYITVIENVFHYKQNIPLHMGQNTIGRYMKNGKINCPIETNDPSIDLHHCTINVGRDKKGRLRYVLTDGPSYTGTFVDNEILQDNERRIIDDGTLFTIGATSVILHTLEGTQESCDSI